MASQVDIMNRALDRLGQRPVSDPEENTKTARLLNGMFPEVRDAVLRAHPWNFAVIRIALAEETTTPVWGFLAQYVKPGDMLRLIEIENNPNYKIEGERILTDTATAINIKYISRITDTTLYDNLFVEALAAKLAYEAAEGLTQSNTKKEEALQAFILALNEAKRIDGNEDHPDQIDEDDWVRARFGRIFRERQ